MIQEQPPAQEKKPAAQDWKPLPPERYGEWMANAESRIASLEKRVKVLEDRLAFTCVDLKDRQAVWYDFAGRYVTLSKEPCPAKKQEGE